MAIRTNLFRMAIVVPAVLYQPLVGFAQEFGFSREPDRERSSGYDRGCSPRQALRVARRIGVKDAEISSIDGRRVVIDGYGWENEYVQLVLGNRTGCPRIR